MIRSNRNTNKPPGFIRRLLRSRNVIIVSAGEVKHYPLSTKVLIASLIVFMTALSWVSYSTGTYLATASLLEAKDRKIEATSRANRIMEEQYALLKHDLVKLQDNTGDMNEFDRFVVQQHYSTMDTVFSGNAQKKEARMEEEKRLSHISQNLMQERVDYLQGMVDQLQEDRRELMTSLRSRTQDQITLYQDIIETTGLNMAKLMQHPSADKLTQSEGTVKNAALELDVVPEEKPSVPQEGQEAIDLLEALEESTEIDAEEVINDPFLNQGGPYVPEGFSSFNEEESSLLKDVDHMMTLSGIISAIPLAKPMDDARISSRYGRRVDPLTKRWASHRGLDFVGRSKGDVMATADGVVIGAGRSGAYGNLVEIQHEFGITTRYAHLRKVMVKRGQKVKQGQVVGLQGNTGRSTGSHLHYEVRLKRASMDPYKFIEAGKNVLK